jgi:hypothetical protein
MYAMQSPPSASVPTARSGFDIVRKLYRVAEQPEA